MLHYPLAHMDDLEEKFIVMVLRYKELAMLVNEVSLGDEPRTREKNLLSTFVCMIAGL
jgi:hypothetical protein